MPRVDLGITDDHYGFPIRITGQPEEVPAVAALMDTGASKCVIPLPLNEQELHFPIVQKGEPVKIANSTIFYDTVLIPRIEVLRPVFTQTASGLTVIFEQTGLYEENVPTWLGGAFIVGMNFIRKFEITMRPNGTLTIFRP